MPKRLKTTFNVGALLLGSVLSLGGAAWGYEAYVTKPGPTLFGDGRAPSVVMLGFGSLLFAGGYRGARREGAEAAAPKPPTPDV